MRILLIISAVVVGIGIATSMVSSYIHPKKNFNDDNLDDDSLDEDEFDEALDSILNEYYNSQDDAWL